MQIDCPHCWPLEWSATLEGQFEILQVECEQAGASLDRHERYDALALLAHLDALSAAATLSAARALMKRSPARTQILIATAKSYCEEAAQAGQELCAPTADRTAPYGQALRAIRTRLAIAIAAARQAGLDPFSAIE